MRFAKNGRYGQGIYFAKSPKYCVDGNFFHSRSDGLRSLIYAFVITGKAATNVDETRNKPPLIPGTNLRYDCVTDNK